MRTVKKQAGFAFFEVILVIAIAAIVGMIGLKIYSARSGNTVSSRSPSSKTTDVSKTSSSVSPAPVVQSTTDLDKAQATLDQNDPSTANQADSSQLDNEADF
ncbi:MAG: hypothetical protein JWO96_766 [Candidatus Saccharibacteria bacterium]|nr:hypothetical protein [Candidatus Saccharibacteria bacterium]